MGISGSKNFHGEIMQKRKNWWMERMEKLKGRRERARQLNPFASFDMSGGSSSSLSSSSFPSTSSTSTLGGFGAKDTSPFEFGATLKCQGAKDTSPFMFGATLKCQSAESGQVTFEFGDANKIMDLAKSCSTRIGAANKLRKWWRSIHLCFLQKRESTISTLRASNFFIKLVRRVIQKKRLGKRFMAASSKLTINISSLLLRRRSMANKLQACVRKFLEIIKRENAASVLCRLTSSPHMVATYKQKYIHARLIEERNAMMAQMRRSNQGPLYTKGQTVETLDDGAMGVITTIREKDAEHQDHQYEITTVLGESSTYSEKDLELASAKTDLSPLLDVDWCSISTDTSETKQSKIERASLSLDPLRRATSRRQRMVQECVLELADVWSKHVPREADLTTPFERDTAKFARVTKQTPAALAKIAIQVLGSSGFQLNSYEDRIEHWRKTWSSDLHQCNLCCEWTPAVRMGYGPSCEETQESEEIHKGETKSTKECDHGADFCQVCLKQYYTLELKEAKGSELPLHGITCPKKCCTPVSDEKVEHLLGPAVFEPLAKVMRTKRIAARPNLRFCPNQGCGMEISKVGTKLRILMKQQDTGRYGMFGGVGGSVGSTQARWFSVSVRELLPGLPATHERAKTADRYRVEFEDETKQDITIELEHIPKMMDDARSAQKRRVGGILHSWQQSQTLPFSKPTRQNVSPAHQSAAARSQSGGRRQTSPPPPPSRGNNIVSVSTFPKLTKPQQYYYYFEEEEEMKLPTKGCKFLPNESVSVSLQSNEATSHQTTVLHRILNVFEITHAGKEKEVVYMVCEMINDGTTASRLVLKKENILKAVDGVSSANIEMFNGFHSRKPHYHCDAGMKVNDRAVVDTSMGNDQCWQCHQLLCIRCGSEHHGSTSCNGAADDVLSAFANDGDKFVQCPKCMGVLERIAGCDHMTCNNLKGLGCSAEFCFKCLSMPHCGPECTKPEKAKKLKLKWKKERNAREQLVRRKLSVRDAGETKMETKHEETKHEEAKQGATFQWDGVAPEGSWVCPCCDVTNTKDEYKCPCCEYIYELL